MVVVPLYDTPQSAGMNTVLEAMSMGRCVVATRSRGLPDCMLDGSAGVVVDSRASELGLVMQSLLTGGTDASSLALSGYRLARQQLTLEVQAAGIVEFLRRVERTGS